MNRKEFSVATQKAAVKRACSGIGIRMVLICEHCHMPIIGERPEFHHKDSRSDDNSLENCLVVHKKCHRLLTDELRPGVDKATRIKNKSLGLTPAKQKIRNRGWPKWD